MDKQWLLDNAFCITSNHEPLGFYRRSGRDTIHLEENYRNIHTEEAVLALKKRGLTMLRTHYHKGMGWEIERADRELTGQMIGHAHKHGLKVQVYIQFGTLHPETYKAEEPGYDDWPMRDRFGNPITLLYSHQNFRHHPCPNRPGYWEHLKRIVREALVVHQADAVGFDNVSWAEEPDICHCDACKAGFTAFLKERYPTAEAATKRFGYAPLDYIVPPAWNFYSNHYNLLELRQPVLQEWAEFRAASLTKRVVEMYQECKRHNPDVFVEINAFRQTGQNSSFITGLYVSDLSEGCDGYWSEMEPSPGYSNGLLHHKIRAYKCAGALDKVLFTGHVGGGLGDEPEPLKKHLLAVSESMVFQFGSINGVGLIRNYLPVKNDSPPHMPLLRFSNANRDMYLAAQLPFVHIYESRASLSNSNFESHYANILMQQVLLREKIPYAIIHDLDNIEDCRAVVLPGMMCLTDAEIRKLTDFVTGGGGLVLTGNTGDFDEFYTGWMDQSLKGCLGIAGHTNGGSLFFGGGLWGDRVDKGGMHLSGVGKGKVAAFPRLSSSRDFDSYDWTSKAFAQSQIWVGPDSWEAPFGMHRIGSAIRWVLHNDLPVVVNAPEAVVFELTGSDDIRYLHLLNYDTSTPAKAVTLSFKDDVKSAVLYIPYAGVEKELDVLCGWENGRPSVVIDEVDVYAVVKVILQS